MAIAVAQLQGLDTPGASLRCFVKRVGVGATGRESRLAILFPHTVERLESRC